MYPLNKDLGEYDTWQFVDEFNNENEVLLFSNEEKTNIYFERTQKVESIFLIANYFLTCFCNVTIRKCCIKICNISKGILF